MASVCTFYIDNLIDAVEERGIAVDWLLREAGLAPQTLDDREGRISYDDYLNLWQVAVRLCDDPLLGLAVGRRFHPGYMGDLASILATAPDLQSAIKELVRYETVLQDGIQTLFGVEGDEAYIEYHCEWAKPEVLQPVVEKDVAESLALAEFIVREGRRDHNLVANRIEFRHPARGSQEAYQTYLKAPVYFGCKANRLYFDAQHLGLPTHSGNAVLFDSVVEQLAQQVDDSVSSQLRQYLAAALVDGVPDIKAAAAHFNLSERTLQRRLSQDGTSYSEQVSRVRQDLACQMLRYQDCSIGEIADRLGFAEASAFNQAFRRWVGKSPSAYRRDPA